MVSFLFGFGISLAWVLSSGCPDLSSTELDTGTGEMTVGKDEDEEDDEELLSCFIGVLEVDEDQEDELDKPGTTIGTKFSVLQIIRIPFLMRCGF